MIYFDYHMHTNFSDDSTEPMENMVKQAVQLGLKEIALTDHVDVDRHYDFHVDYTDYCKEIERLRAQYPIRIVFGAEVGFAPDHEKEANELIQKHPYEFIICSTHSIKEYELHLPAYYERPKKEAYTEYFEDVLNTTKTFEGYHVYGHIDYIFRYGYRFYEDYAMSYSDYQDLMDEIFKNIIEKGKGVEVNTSGYRYGLDTAHPQKDNLKRYLELGGEILTIGSDSHNRNDIGAHFKTAEAYLRHCGVKYICTFENGRPVFHSL